MINNQLPLQRYSIVFLPLCSHSFYVWFVYLCMQYYCSTPLNFITFCLWLFVTGIIACTSRQEKTSGLTKPAAPPRKYGTINKIDTARYKPIAYTFYGNKAGDIFELKYYVWEDSTGFYDVAFLDSLIFIGEYPNTKPLKDVIDLASFEIDTITDFFSKDKRHVYFTYGTSDGAIRKVITNADVKTFCGVGARWGKDKNHVFYGTEIVPGVDLASFQVSQSDVTHDTAFDKRHIYYLGEIVK